MPGCDDPRETHGPAPVPTRIVALSPAIARTLSEAGAAGLLVGRHAFDPWTDARVPVCGDQSGIDYEALLAARPSHVLLQWGRRDLPARLVSLARARGWTIRDYPLLTLDEVISGTDDLWTLATAAHPQPPSAAPAGARLRTILNTGVDPAARARVGRVLMLASTRPPVALGPGSFHHDMLTRLGAQPAIEHGVPYITLDAEDLLRLAPEAIILVQPRFETSGSQPQPAVRELSTEEARTRLKKLGDLKLPALTRGRVALIDDPLCFVPGSNLAPIAQGLAAQLRAWADTDARPPQE